MGVPKEKAKRERNGMLCYIVTGQKFAIARRLSPQQFLSSNEIDVRGLGTDNPTIRISQPGPRTLQ